MKNKKIPLKKWLNQERKISRRKFIKMMVLASIPMLGVMVCIMYIIPKMIKRETTKQWKSPTHSTKRKE